MCIDLLEKQELNTHALLKDQVQIISSTISNFNETIHKFNYDETIINRNLQKLSENINTTNTGIFNLQTIEQISTISIQLLESVITLEQEINDLLTSILFIKSGTIHPSIISSEQIFKELLLTSHSRTELNLVATPKAQNIHEIIESASISSYMYKGKLVFILSFPLVKPETFNLYHIYSVPIRHPNSSIYTTLIPEHPYLAMSTTRQNYASLNSIENCKPFAPKKTVCHDIVIYNYNTRPSCEVAVLLSTVPQLPSSCKPVTFLAQITTFQPLKNNRWLYVLQHDTSCVLQCGQKSTNHKLTGIGIIALPQNCKLYTSLVTLTASTEITTNYSHPIVTIDIEEDCIKPINHKAIPNPELLPLKMNDIRLDSLSIMKDQLDKYSEELYANQGIFNNKNSNNLHLFTWTIALIMLGYLLYKCCPCIALCKKIFTKRTHNHGGSGCIQIFNNCFDKSRRTQIIPLKPHQMTTSYTMESDAVPEDASSSPRPQRLRNKQQSLF